jgi:hypothetical protein
MQYPVYDENESPFVFIQKCESFANELKKYKYDIIIKFINNITESHNITFKSLTDFKNISYLDNIQNNKIIKLTGKKIIKSLNVTFNFDNLHNDSLIEFLNVLLDTIQYSLIVKNINEKTYLTIIPYPSKIKKNKIENKEVKLKTDKKEVKLKTDKKKKKEETTKVDIDDSTDNNTDKPNKKIIAKTLKTVKI